MVAGSKLYLSKLRATSGQKLIWERKGWISYQDINGFVDTYEGRLPSGEFYANIYINMYAGTNSPVAPQGFTIID